MRRLRYSVRNSTPQGAYSVEFEALHGYDRGANGFLRFRAGAAIFVWNETGDADADLGVVDADGQWSTTPLATTPLATA